MAHHILKISICTLLLMVVPIYADNAPVTDITQSNDPAATTFTPPSPPLTMDQRVAKLEQQMANLVQMNLPQQITQLQQTLAQLQGQLQMQQHDLQSLSDQQKSFYQDLDQRITQLKTAALSKPSAPDVNPAVAAPNQKLQDPSAYQAAIALLTQKQYEPAKAAFQKYLTNYPKGQFLVNAHYWLGEIYLMQRNNTQAAAEFSTIIKQFPNSNKVSDAKLKLAMIHVNLGNTAQAKQEFIQIKSQYPGTTAAQLADIQLQQLKVMANAATSVGAQ